MRISKLRVVDFKSFNGLDTIELAPGFNIVTGKNNAGKTALLEAASLGTQFKLAPHRSLATLPTQDAQIVDASKVWIEFVTSGEEIRQLLSIPNAYFYLPLPVVGSDIAQKIGYQGENGEHIRALEYLFACDEIRFGGLFTRNANGSGVFSNLNGLSFDAFDFDIRGEDSYRMLRVDVKSDKTFYDGGVSSTDNSQELGIQKVLPALRERVYFFRAERMHVGKCPFGQGRILASDASNLPEVLNRLQGEGFRFQRFVGKIKEILPQINHVSVLPDPSASNYLEIKIWAHDPATERSDLAVPLLESGTGISQVLAILYVAITSDTPRTIVIDEPQSFLHPGAVRKLIEVLREYHQHQFIIGTHSPTAISAAQPKTITLVTQTDGVSRLSKIDGTKNEELTLLLAEVGASLSDVFGADHILWVEGATEEICFPKIITQLISKPTKGLLVKGVRATGDFTGKHADLIVDIYNRISGTSSLLPPSLAFIFDDEGRTNQDKKDLNKLSGGKTLFLNRRMFENYLLHPVAICAVANVIEGFREKPLTEDEVTNWIERRKEVEGYGEPSDDLATWEQYANGSKLLEDLFAELSEARVAFRKPIHSSALVDWLLEYDPEQLMEIVELLQPKVT